MLILPPPFLTGLLVGFLVTAPVGPICVLCIQRSVVFGRRIGIASGLGSALALTLYGVLGAIGVTVIAQVPSSLRLLLSFFGATILVCIGVKLLKSLPVSQAGDSVSTLTSSRALLSTFVLEIVNPASIMIFVSLYASMQTIPSTNVRGYFDIGFGIFLASMVWWILLSSAASFLRFFLSNSRLIWLNRVSGILIIFLGLYPLFQTLFSA